MWSARRGETYLFLHGKQRIQNSIASCAFQESRGGCQPLDYAGRCSRASSSEPAGISWHYQSSGQPAVRITHGNSPSFTEYRFFVRLEMATRSNPRIWKWTPGLANLMVAQNVEAPMIWCRDIELRSRILQWRLRRISDTRRASCLTTTTSPAEGLSHFSLAYGLPIFVMS